MNDIQSTVDEIQQLIQKIEALKLELLSFDSELKEINTKLTAEIGDHLKTAHQYSSNANKFDEQFVKELFQYIDKHIVEEVEKFSKELSQCLSDPSLMDKAKAKATDINTDAMLKTLQNSLERSSPIKKVNSSAIAQRQLAACVIGNKGDVHHELIRNKFSKACQKVICLNNLQSRISKVVNLEILAEEQPHEKVKSSLSLR